MMCKDVRDVLRVGNDRVVGFQLDDLVRGTTTRELFYISPHAGDRDGLV